MHITFLGVGSAFTTRQYYQSNILVTATNGKRLLIDCGGDARLAFKDHCGTDDIAALHLDAVYLSHLHADHIGGMEWLAFTSYFAPSSIRLHLFGETTLLDQLWQHSLRGGLEWVDGGPMSLDDYFSCHPLQPCGKFLWHGIEFSLVPLPHIVTPTRTIFSYGLLLKAENTDGPCIAITTDTRFELNPLMPLYQKADIIFHDCETGPPTSVHAHYLELCTLPPDLRQKMWLYHYQPDPVQDPRADGFQGFARKGQSFDFFKRNRTAVAVSSV